MEEANDLSRCKSTFTRNDEYHTHPDSELQTVNISTRAYMLVFIEANHKEKGTLYSKAKWHGARMNVPQYSNAP